MKNEKDVKGLYNLTAQLSGTKSTTTPQYFIHEGKTVSKPEEMANLHIKIL